MKVISIIYAMYINRFSITYFRSYFDIEAIHLFIGYLIESRAKILIELDMLFSTDEIATLRKLTTEVGLDLDVV